MSQLHGYLSPGERPLDHLEASPEALEQLVSQIERIGREHGSASLGYEGMLHTTLVLNKDTDLETVVSVYHYEAALGIPSEVARAGLVGKAEVSENFDWSDPENPTSDSLRIDLFRHNGIIATHKTAEAGESLEVGVATENDTRKVIDLIARSTPESGVTGFGSILRPGLLEEVRARAAENTVYSYDS